MAGVASAIERLRRRRTAVAGAASNVDLSTRVGGVGLPNPILTASGTSGHGAELAPYVDLGSLGAVVVKSLKAEPWAGNPAPRVHALRSGMINSVGLQGPGVAGWIADDLPGLAATGARVVASIWGHSVDEYLAAAEALADLGEFDDSVVAVEVNMSCPNTDGEMFAHNPAAAAQVVGAAKACGLPLWAKLSPNVTDIVPIAASVADAGAAAVTLTNTLMGLALDVDSARPVLGNGGGGVSGAPLHAVAVRAVYTVSQALPDLPIVGVGGVASGTDAIEFLMAGASAVQVGTATFAEPAATARILSEVEAWCVDHGVASIDSLIATAHLR